jgi:hypothetical protein
MHFLFPGVWVPVAPMNACASVKLNQFAETQCHNLRSATVLGFAKKHGAPNMLQ